MFTELKQKVSASHLARNAYLYVRQSTLRQVFENTESTKRQYALQEKALALGWTSENIIVIDSDLGQSGAQATDREGFQRLVADVSLGKAGVVLGLEVSRLARNSSDWHRLLEICAFTDTLILDEDGLYNPAHFNDRLLLGLKGTMSEAELHVMRARLVGGQRSKAKRGELKLGLPVGFIYDSEDRVRLDPDQQVRDTVKLFFDTFIRTGSAFMTCRELNKQNILFPRRVRKGPNLGEIVWAPITHTSALHLLHNPRYAGAYSYGRRHYQKQLNGRMVSHKRAQNDWIALVPAAHEGYISWEHYEENQRKLLERAQAFGHERRKSPPREGPALLQGLVVCGVCGDRMTVRYHSRRGKLIPDYLCQKQKIERCESRACQNVPGTTIEKFIFDLLLETISPVVLEVAVSVQDELLARHKETNELRKKHLERLKYEVELSRQRYLCVDPNNRLVAASLEADWNDKLRVLTDAQQEYEKQSQETTLKLSDEQRQEIMSLASNFPKLWNHPDTPDRERKRIVRLVIEDATLRKTADGISIDVRFKGGALHSAVVPVPLNGSQLRKTRTHVVEQIDQLLDRHSDDEIVTILNTQGQRTGPGGLFTMDAILRIRVAYDLKSRYDRLQEQGCLTRKEMIKLVGVTNSQLNWVREQGLVCGHRSGKTQFLYEPPSKRQVAAIRQALVCQDQAC